MRFRSVMTAVGVASVLTLGAGLATPVFAQPQTEVKNSQECEMTPQARNTGALPSYLFVFTGRNAELKPLARAGTFELTVPLNSSNRLVTWFTDRPNRDAGHMRMRDFASLWQKQGENSFKNDPPNVAISSDNKTVIATMTKPRIVKTKGGGHAFTSTMTLVKGNDLKDLLEKDKKLGAHAERAGANSLNQTLKLRDVSVFVDDLVLGCTICNIHYMAPDCCSA
jgi:hypothetical protein